jgi:hypothetical protein
MEKIKKIREMYEKGKDNSNDNNNINPEDKQRRVSVNIKHKVNIFEKQIEECENLRKSQNLFEIMKKFGLQKFCKHSEENSINDYNNDISNNTQLKLNISNNNFDIINFVKEVEVMCDNYDKEIEFYKKQTSIKSNNEITNTASTNDINTVSICKLCDKLIKEIEKQKAIVKEKEEIIENLQKKFQEFDTHMNSMMTYLHVPESTKLSSDFHLDCFKDRDNNSNYDSNFKSFNNGIEKEKKLKNISSIISEIISQNIFYEYKLDNSVNLNCMNKKLLSYFPTFLTTSFFKESDNNITGNLFFSIYNEYLQDIIIQIYFSFLKYKSKTINGINNLNNNSYSWVVSEEDINEEILNMSVEEIFNLHIKIRNLNNFFENVYENKIYLLELDKTQDKNEICELFLKKVYDYHDKIKKDIYKIVKICRNYIHAGKVVYRNNILYDYWKLYQEVIHFEEKNKSKNFSIYYSPLENSLETSDKLIHEIKFNSKNINEIFINHGIYNDDSCINEHHDTDDEIKFENTMNKPKIPFNSILSHILINNELLQNLKSLTISNNKISDSNIIFINNIIEFGKNITTFDLSNNNMGDKGLRLISETLKINKSIRTIHLSFNEITSNGAFYIADMLLKNITIINLFLGGNSITGLGLQSLINILINNNKSIKLLDLSTNNLNHNDIIIISNLLMKNCENIKCLNISNNLMDTDSLNTLGLVLKVNTNLKKIYLNNVGLNEESSPYFFQHLLEAHIEEIYLEENSLGEVGGVLFANVIKTNHCLKQISLKKTLLNSISLLCICHALELEIAKGFIKLELLNLEENEFDNSSINSLINTFLPFTEKDINNYLLPKISLTGELLSEEAVLGVMKSKVEKILIL